MVKEVEEAYRAGGEGYRSSSAKRRKTQRMKIVPQKEESVLDSYEKSEQMILSDRVKGLLDSIGHTK